LYRLLFKKGKRLKSNHLNIAVTGTGSLIGQAIIKSIKGSVYKESTILGMDYFEDTVGSYWCSENKILPDILSDNINEDMWLSSLENYLLEHKIDILFPGVDFELLLLSRNKNELENKTGAKIIVSPEPTITISDDKYETYLMLKKAGLAYPESFLPDEDWLGKLSFPFIIKPRKGARSKGVFLVSSIEDYKRKIELVNDPVLQEYVGNQNREYTCGVIGINGQFKKAIVLNRSLKEGNTFKSKFSFDTPPNIYNYIQSIAEVLSIHGSCNFQLRLDKENNPKLFEINARCSGTTFMRKLFGYNEVEFIISCVMFGKEELFKLREGEAIRYFEEKLLNN
jgi:carbamoyl-phosphate synthase large subunit